MVTTWLNEGFASWMTRRRSSVSTRISDRPITDGTSTAMNLDARQGTHPVVQVVNTIDEANLAFDTITYEKGLAVLRMLEAYVGEDDFTGVRATSTRIATEMRVRRLYAVQAASGQPVLEIARSLSPTRVLVPPSPGPIVLRARLDARNPPATVRDG